MDIHFNSRRYPNPFAAHLAPVGPDRQAGSGGEAQLLAERRVDLVEWAEEQRIFALDDEGNGGTEALVQGGNQGTHVATSMLSRNIGEESNAILHQRDGLGLDRPALLLSSDQQVQTTPVPSYLSA